MQSLSKAEANMHGVDARAARTQRPWLNSVRSPRFLRKLLLSATSSVKPPNSTSGSEYRRLDEDSLKLMAVEQPGPGPADGTSGVIVSPIASHTPVAAAATAPTVTARDWPSGGRGGARLSGPALISPGRRPRPPEAQAQAASSASRPPSPTQAGYRSPETYEGDSPQANPLGSLRLSLRPPARSEEAPAHPTQVWIRIWIRYVLDTTPKQP